ncbi:Golgi transport complex subunit 1 [Actinomortierella wolfii]|nr:Golgi transport complex subunit 1 [Actinomortierella wolfii]
MTMMASDHQLSSVKDADELFIKLSVPDLNVYERKIRTDIEKKKQELRTMVGERYRDLIGAADRIVRMKETVLQVQNNLAGMRESCDVHALKRRVAAKVTATTTAATGAGSDGEVGVDGTKKAFYSSAAQIKLLVDAPEQIWRNMEHHNYLTASRLYLISQAIHQNLRPDDSEMDVQKKKFMESFPIVGRQWDAVRHFKAQILNKSKQRLREESLADHAVIETMSAIMLLDNVTIKDMFLLLLEQRRGAIRDILKHKGQKDIGMQLVQAIQTFKATLVHIDVAFRATGSDSKSRLERHLQHLERTFSSPADDSVPWTEDAVATGNPLPSSTFSDVLSTNTTAATVTTGHTGTWTTQVVIPQLYPTTPNIHLLVRYLPESVQTLRPSIALATKLPQAEMHSGLQSWVDETLAMFGDELERLLEKVSTTKQLVRIRRAVWDAIRQDELELLRKKKKNEQEQKDVPAGGQWTVAPASAARKQPSWGNVCQILLNKSLSLWEMVLRGGFRKAFQNIIIVSLEELSKQPQAVLRARLAELDLNESPDRDVGRFVWHESAASSTGTSATSTAAANSSTTATTNKKLAAPSLSVTAAAAANALTTATGPLATRIRECVSGWTPLVADMARIFETQLLDVRLDQEAVLVLCKRDVYGRRRRNEHHSATAFQPRPGPHDTQSEQRRKEKGGYSSDSDSSSDFDDDMSEDEDEEEEKGDEGGGPRWTESDGDGLFGVVADHQALLDFYQSHSMECVTAYRTSLDILVQEALQKPEGACHTLTAMDRAMAIGRLAACLASLAPFFRQVLLPPAVEQQQQQQNERRIRKGGAQRGLLAAARESKAKVDEYAAQMAQGFHEVYLAAHQAWIEHMGWLLNRRLRDAYLYDRLTCASIWGSDLATLSWEPMATITSAAPPLSPTAGRASTEVLSPTANSGSTSNTTTKTLLPFHTSTKLMMVLEGVVQEIHRVGVASMRPDLVQRLTAHLAMVAYKALNKFLDTVIAVEGHIHEHKKIHKEQQEGEDSVIRLTEKGALQLLFDVKYLALCFQASTSRDDKLKHLATSVQDRVKQHIDPINLEVFEGPIEKNVEQQYQRTWTMLGLLVQLNKKPVQSARKKVDTGTHHVLAMAPLSTRFTLLPIGQKISSGRIV